MSGESKTVATLKGQLSKFSGIISKRFKKPKHRLIKEMLYGIQASKDVKLSNIARTLKEKKSLIKTEDRLPGIWMMMISPMGSTMKSAALQPRKSQMIW
jgi:hypothetical protein